MSNYNELKLTYQDGRQETITLTGNTIESGEYQERDIVAVEVPEIVERIEEYAFCDNNNLSSITLSEGLMRIGDQAFQHGVYTAVTIPSTVTYIGWNSFNTRDEQFDDQHTFTVICLAQTPPSLDDGEGITFGDPELLQAIYVPAGSVSTYRSAWSDYASKIQALPTPTPTTGFSTLDIVSAYVGTEIVERLYLGDELVWGGEPGPDYSKMPLTFNIISGGTINWRATSASFTKEIYYSINDGPWVPIISTTDGTPISLNSGDVVQFQGDGAISTGQKATNRFRDSTIVFEVYGNVASLTSSTGYITATTAADHSFRQLFASQTGLTSAEHLVLQATTVGANAYKDMFKDCISLTKAPELPAAALAQSSYFGMFQNCTNLTEAPELPATTLAPECYRQMFSGCTSLTTAPSSIGTSASTVLASGCTSMFYGCTSLRTAPELPATTLANNCYLGMFYGCSNLEIAPELPAETLAQSCYQEMFRGCTSLMTAPYILPATTLAQDCYRSMFNGCTSLETAPVLPATTLANNCYFYMFEGCTLLRTAPELPATTLIYSCYSGMFKGCGSLARAPELPATALANYCYSNMFNGCISLSYIKCLATNISAEGCTTNWVDGVASYGRFIKDPDMNDWPSGTSGIPDGWTVEDADI